MAVTPSAELLISLRLSEAAGSGPGRQVFRSNVLGPTRPLHQRMRNDSTLDLKQPASNGVANLFLGGSGGGVLVQSARNSEDPGVALLSIPNGITVTANTGDLIEITNNDGSNAANAYVGLWGVSA